MHEHGHLQLCNHIATAADFTIHMFDSSKQCVHNMRIQYCKPQMPTCMHLSICSYPSTLYVQRLVVVYGLCNDHDDNARPLLLHSDWRWSKLIKGHF